MKIQNITRADARRLHEEVAEAAANIAAQYGLRLLPGNARYSDTSLSIPVKFETTGEGGIPAGFALDARWLGLPEDCWGQQFRGANGTVYTITGINLRRRKYPVSGRGPKGGSYKFTADAVKRGLLE